MATITVEHVRKRFASSAQVSETSITALDDVSFKLPDGEVLVLLGPSGCGKSTLLRIIAGLVQADSGRVLYDNVPLHEVPLKDRGIGMVFQEGALVPHWESGRSVGFFLRLRRREHEVPERVRRIAQITGFGLQTLLERRPRQLSGGEQQRVGIARALVRDPRLFLFDEPFSNLDAKLRTTARVELKRLLQEFPVTSIYVTHDQVEAMALSNRIAVMRDGKIVQIDPYLQLYDNPVNLFVATFIGLQPINLFEGRIDSARWYGEHFGGYVARADLESGTRVTLGIRPEHVRFTDEGIAGTVEDVTPFYAERYQLVTIRAGRERWTLMLPLDAPIGVGETRHCALDDAGLLYFDAQTGVRIG